MKKALAVLRTASPLGRGPIAVVVMVAVLACATSVALADDGGKNSHNGAQSTSEDTTSTAEDTTSTSEETTTEETTTEETTSDDLDPNEGQTTTTSDELNAQAAELAAVTTNTQNNQVECDPNGPKVEPITANQVSEVTLNTTLTLTFTFNDDGEGEANAATWTSSAPFTGQIIVKSGSGASSNEVFEYTGATAGTITSPNVNDQGKTQAISHIQVCNDGTTSTSTTTSTATTSTTTSTATTSTTIPPTSTTTTPTSTTSTPTSTTTGAVAGDTGSGGGGGAAGEQGGGGRNDPVATQARTSEGDLPFTGLHAPLLALIGLGMAIGGLAIRRSLQDAA